MSVDVLRDVKDSRKVPCFKITSALNVFPFLFVNHFTRMTLTYLNSLQKSYTPNVQLTPVGAHPWCNCNCNNNNNQNGFPSCLLCFCNR